MQNLFFRTRIIGQRRQMFFSSSVYLKGITYLLSSPFSASVNVNKVYFGKSKQNTNFLISYFGILI